jgi:hypothetical protein
MQYSRAPRKMVPTILCLAVALFVPPNIVPAKHIETAQTFELRVQFGFPWKDRVEIKTNISPDVPFGGNATDKEGHRYDIGGMLLPHAKGKYRVVLTVRRWDEPGGDSFGTLVPEMDLNKTVTGCSSDGIIHGCIATTLSPISDTKTKGH